MSNRNGHTLTIAALPVQRRARKVGLTYVNNFEAGINRRRQGKSFVYVSSRGKPIKAARMLHRIESLVIPPAWEEVWICSQANGHIQAIGRDDFGRRQYLYHPKWQSISTATKYDRMHLLVELLPRIRRKVRHDLEGNSLSKERVLAAIVRLLDKAHLRVGNERYAAERGSRGATTLTNDHVEVDRFTISLDFPGKSGQQHEIEFSDAKTAKVIRQCEQIDGQYLFCYRDAAGEYRDIHSTDVNTYLREISGEAITAKDFRTWWGSVIVLASLADISADLSLPQRKKALTAAVAVTAQELGNTKAVCRGSYIHPGILAAAESGELPALLAKVSRSRKKHAEMTVDEVRFATLIPHLDFS